MAQSVNTPLQKLSTPATGTRPLPEKKPAETKASMISLAYTFIFAKEANLWNKLADFESDLSDFFAANGLEAERIATVEGSMGGRMMMIKRIEIDQKLENTKGVNLQMLPVEKKSAPSSTTVKQLVKQMEKNMKPKRKGVHPYSIRNSSL